MSPVNTDDFLALHDHLIDESDGVLLRENPPLHQELQIASHDIAVHALRAAAARQRTSPEKLAGMMCPKTRKRLGV